MELLMHWIHNETAARFTILAFVTLVVLGVVRLFQPYLARGIKEATTRYRTRRFVNLAGYLTIVIAAMSIFSDRLGVVGVVLGVAGAGIAFALQELVASVAGWFVIAFGRFYKAGDRVQLGGIRGDVIDIGVLRTTVMECSDWEKGGLYSGGIVRIPNSSVFKGPAFNYSADFPFLWDEITVHVQYGSDYAFVREMLQRIAEEVAGEDASRAQSLWKHMVAKYAIEDEQIEPTVSMVLAEKWVEFTARYVVDYKTRRGQKDQLFSRILEEVAKNPDRVALAMTPIVAAAPAPSTLRKDTPR
jgi:small-conductance mechanosensitive channel